jgi:hypothetical protein
MRRVPEVLVVPWAPIGREGRASSRKGRNRAVRACGRLRPRLHPQGPLVAEATAVEPDADHKVRCPESEHKIEAALMLDGLRGTGMTAQFDRMTAQLDAMGVLSRRLLLPAPGPPLAPLPGSRGARSAQTRRAPGVLAAEFALDGGAR